MNKVSVTHISNAHNRWLRSLDFYKQEIIILEKMLTEIARKNTGNEVMRHVEHFDNQFNIQLNNISKLAHDIKGNLKKIGKQAETSTAGYIDNDLLSTHDKLEDNFEVEEKVINELRADFHHFASEWM
jgi:hypothetical protein